MSLLRVDGASPVPPFEQLRSQVVAAVDAGDLAPGERLPPVRRLAADLGVAAGTVARAYKELEADGVVETRPVELGISAGDEVEITAGVGEGERVVSLAGTFVRDGDRVTPVAAEPRVTAEAAR